MKEILTRTAGEVLLPAIIGSGIVGFIMVAVVTVAQSL